MAFKFSFSEDWTSEERAESWFKEVERYGKNPYVLGVLNLIEQTHPRRVFDVACGNGFPFASSLLEKNIEVHGCDLSLPLLQEAARLYPALRWHHTDYEHIVEKTGGEQYDVVYCLRSTWYFPDITRALENILKITKPGGTVIFDIMNSESPDISNGIRVLRKKKYRTFFKNAVKFFLNKIARTAYTYDRGMDKNYTVSPSMIEAFLETKKLLFQKFTFGQVSGESADFDPQAFRILYMVRVPEAMSSAL